MKKYLITGALALVACATLTSCHSDDELSGSLIEQKLMAYEQVFEEEFGKVNPNQDWGFGTANILARTRAAMGRTRADGEWANYHGEYADANLWTSKGFHAPDALTPGQKLRVQFYFQTVKNPGGTHDYGTIDFFMQQVYDGATDPITNYSGYTSPTYSLEVYPAANGTDFIQSGEHMDHLVAGDNNTMEHINNFNNGNFPDPIPHVANWNQTVQDDPNQEHEDQIMLMINTPTQYFSYANSSPSKVRKDRWTLVSGEVIDNYCDNVNNSGWTAFLNAHSGVEDDPCYDEWERSYIGFDFDMLPSEDLYATIGYDASGNIVYNPNQTPARTEYVYFGIPLNQIQITNQTQVWNGTQLVNLTDVGEIGYVNGNAYFYPFKEGTTEKINVLTEKTNMYCGVPETWADTEGKYVYTNNGTSYLRLDYVYQALDDMKMPVKDNHRQWVTIGKCNDGYYSDWIVSFLPADGNYTPSPKTDEIDIEQGTSSSYTQRTYKQLRYRTDLYQNGRILCEDLGTSSISDIDFNDIVFDAWMYHIVPEVRTKVVKIENNSETILQDWSEWYNYDYSNDSEHAAYFATDVYLLAGGGTIPATVGGVSFKNALGTDTPFLVNTVDDRDNTNVKRYGNPYDNTIEWHQPEDLKDMRNIGSLNDIEVIVLYNKAPVPLTAEVGEIPHKICVPVGTKWPYERVVINEAYDFNDYVKNGSSVNYKGNSIKKSLLNSNNEVIGYYYYLDERNRVDEDEENIWTKRATETQKDSRYHGKIDDESDITGIPYKDSARVIEGEGSYTTPENLPSEEITVGGGSGSGYRQGDDVLVRRRH